jgi:hypothetical protein
VNTPKTFLAILSLSTYNKAPFITLVDTPIVIAMSFISKRIGCSKKREKRKKKERKKEATKSSSETFQSFQIKGGMLSPKEQG